MAKTYRLGPTRQAINVVMTAAIRLGVGPHSSYLLTTTGRKTGRQRTTPVILVETGPDRWLVSPYGTVGWVHNVRAVPQVILRRGRTTEMLFAHELDAGAAGPVLQRYVGAVPVTAPFFDAKSDDPLEHFVREAAHHPVFELTQGQSSGRP